jgi:hypothetical protein
MTRGARRAPEGVATIESDHFSASFDAGTGTFSIVRSNGTPFLSGGVG